MIHQNKLSKKFLLLCFAIFLVFIIACNTTSQPISPDSAPTFDPNWLGTNIAQTAYVASTQTAAYGTATFTPTPTFINALEISSTATSTSNTGSFKPGDPTATPLGSEITDPNFIAGVEAFNKKDYEQVIVLMSSVISSNPNLAPPYRYRGHAYYWYLEDCVKSLADYDQALTINPDYAAVWGGRALANKCLGNKTQYFLDLQKALSIDPSFVPAHANLGVYYFDQGNYEKSFEEYTISTEIDPNLAFAWSGKAQALFKLGRYEECIISASKAIEIDPELWLAYSDRAFCEDFMGNDIAAIKDYQTYVDNSDANAATWYNLGLAQRKVGDFEAAIVAYNKALELDPSYYQAYINRGNVYVLQENYKEAIADYNKAIELSNISNAYSGRGDAYYGLKEYSKAIEDYKTAAELNPLDAHSYCHLSYSYFEVKKYQESIDAAEASRQINSSCGGQKLLEIEARSYYELKKYEQALLYINKTFEMGEYTPGYYYRGVIYQAMDMKAKAIQDLETFLDLSQSSEDYLNEIKDAKSRLTQLKK